MSAYRLPGGATVEVVHMMGCTEFITSANGEIISSVRKYGFDAAELEVALERVGVLTNG